MAHPTIQAGIDRLDAASKELSEALDDLDRIHNYMSQDDPDNEAIRQAVNRFLTRAQILERRYQALSQK
jgi:hypothetical protein